MFGITPRDHAGDYARITSPAAPARRERRELAAEARAAALAREDAVVDLPSVLRLASRAVDALVRSTLNAQGMACRTCP